MNDTDDRRVTELEQENADLRAEVERLREWRKQLLDEGFGYDDSEESAKEVLDWQPAWRAAAAGAEADRDRLAAQIQQVRDLRDRLLAHAGRSAWVGPWVQAENVMVELDAILDADGGRDDTGDHYPCRKCGGTGTAAR